MTNEEKTIIKDLINKEIKNVENTIKQVENDFKKKLYNITYLEILKEISEKL